MGNYRRIYPGVDTAEKYDKFYIQSGTLYSETAASKARLEQSKYIEIFNKKELFHLFHRAQIDELQRKQDKLNAFKNRKLNPGTSNINSKEVTGESPTRKPLSTVKISRSSSINRPPLKRLTAVSCVLLFRVLFLNLLTKRLIFNEIYRNWLFLIDIHW